MERRKFERVKLTRYSSTAEGTVGVMGRLKETSREYSEPDTLLEWKTLERPWCNDEPFLSCIPAGQYIARLHASPRHGLCLIVEGGNVFAKEQCHIGPHRYGILIHPANVVSELEGCIALGMDAGVLDGKRAVLESRRAVGQLYNWVAINGGIVGLWITWEG